MVESFDPDVKGSMMGLIFWIDENTFATNLVERALKGQGVDFYTVKDAKDFSYLIEDLKPQIVVIDSQTALKDIEVFKKQFEQTQSFFNAKIVVIEGNAELSFLGDQVKVLQRPFDPFKLKEFFSQI